MTKARFYMMLPVILLFSSVLGWIYMIGVAVDDPTFAVEEDYYQKAANYDAVLAKRRQSERLGWTAKIVRFSFLEGTDQARVEMVLEGSRGELIEGANVQIEALANLRADDVRRLSLTESCAETPAHPLQKSEQSTRSMERPCEQEQRGHYVGVLQRPWPGIWELRISATSEGNQFVDRLRAELSRERI